MFRRLFASSPVVPEEIHRAAWRMATQSPDTELQKTLIARDDAPADLLAHYATLTSTQLRGVYLGRNDTSDDQIVAGVAGERRASVLADAMRRSSGHLAVLAVAADVFVKRPTKALLSEMERVSNARMTPALAQAVLSVLDLTPHGTGITTPLDRIAGQLGRDRARALIVNLTNVQVMTSLMRYDIGDDLVVDAVRRALPERVADMTNQRTVYWAARDVEHLIDASIKGREHLTELPATFLKALRPYSGDTVVRLRARVTGAAKPARLLPWPEGAGDESRVVVTEAELVAAEEVVDVSTQPLDALALLAVSRSAAVVAQVAARAVQFADEGNAQDSLMLTLLANPLLTVSDRHALLKAIHDNTGHGGSAPATFDAVAAFPDDDVALALWTARFPAAVLRVHGWEPFGGRSKAIDLVPKWAAEGASGNCSSAAVVVALQRGLEADVLKLLPLKQLKAAWGYSRDDNNYVSLTNLAAVLADGFGDDANMWALYEGLRDTFPGTLGELIETVRAAAA